MKWFKHMANARDDEFIEWLEENYGFEGVGRWWRILEIIADSMEKNRNDPSANHTWSKWQTLLRGKRSQLLSFLLAIQLRSKIKLVVTEKEMKITCDKILKMRDNYTKDLQASGKLLASDLLLEAEAEKEKELNTTPLPPSEPVDNSEPKKPESEKPAKEKIPIPKMKFEEKKDFKNVNNFAAAAAACCQVLHVRRLSPLDETFLTAWLEKYDFEKQIMPLIAEKSFKFQQNNNGKSPASLSYFTECIKDSFRRNRDVSG